MTQQEEVEQLLAVAKLAYKTLGRVGEVFVGRCPDYFSQEIHHARLQLATAIADMSTVTLDQAK